VLEVAGYLKLD